MSKAVIFALSVLYFIEGVPYGLQDKLIPHFLRLKNLSFSQVTLSRLLLIPWISKPVISALIDHRWTKRRWLQMFLAFLAIVSGIMAFTSSGLSTFYGCLFLLNVFSACLDVSVDSIALDVLSDSSLGSGNAAQVSGYKVGALFGGGLLYYVQYFIGWDRMFYILASFYILSLLLITLMDITKMNPSKAEYDKKTEPPLKNGNVVGDVSSDDKNKAAYGVRKRLTKSQDVSKDEKDSLKKEAEVAEAEKEKMLDWKNGIVASLKVVGTWEMCFFLAIYKIGEFGMLSTYPSILVDEDIPPITIGLLNGICAQSCSIFGSLIGGKLASNPKRNKTFLFYSCVIRVVPALLMFLSVAKMLSEDHQLFTGLVMLMVLSFVSGIVTTITFTMMMQCSKLAPEGFRTMHFSLLCTVEVTFKLILVSFVGVVIDGIGMNITYLMLVVFTAISVIPVLWIKVT